MARVRYLLRSDVEPTSDISSGYRLAKYSDLGNQVDALRLTIPDYVNIINEGDYDIIEEHIEVKELKPKILIRMNGELKENNYLTDYWLAGEFKLDGIMGYMALLEYSVVPNFGYLDEEQLKYYSDNIERVWQLNKIPPASHRVELKPASQFPDLLRSVRELVTSESRLAYGKELTSDKLLSVYAKVCMQGNIKIQPVHLNTKHLNYIKRVMAEELSLLKIEAKYNKLMEERTV
jgi:hypothetical protein